jgi:hypothetical protein
MSQGTEVKPCNCKSEFQDGLYGKGNRLHNKGEGKSKDSKPPLKCTICGTKK